MGINTWMRLGTWVSGGLGIAELMVELDDRTGLFQA